MPAPFDYTVSPNPSNDPADDAPVMQKNSQSIQDIIAVDHVQFNDNLGGYHNQVSFAINQSAPGLGGGKAELYANTASGQSWPFWQNAIASATQLAGPSTKAINGSTFLPGGIILKWGTQAIGAGANVSGSVAFPGGNFNTVYTCLTSLVCKASGTASSSNTICIKNTTLAVGGFDWIFNGNSGSFPFFNWIAIGV